MTQITDAAFTEYRADPGTIADMRQRFAQWRRGLLSASPGSTTGTYGALRFRTPATL